MLQSIKNKFKVTMAELAVRSPHDQKVVGSNPAGSKSDLSWSHIVYFTTR